MMTFFSRISIIIFLILLCSTPALAQPYSGPDDKRAIKEAEKAVKRLGPDRGAIDIIGLESVSISGSSVGITKTLRDLGAKQVGEEIHITLSGDVLFDFDKWDIKEEAEATLLKLAQGIKETKKEHVLIEGHTDSKGSDPYNLELSQKRADSVRDWFVSKGGVTGVQFQTKGYGETKPVAHNTKPDGSDNPEGRAKNRRVEIKILD
jgi:outer membrane protein OmpA-like peptidoglycan-associated protein